jgi:transcriptional regulator with XRE-family HTH domain
MADLNIFDFKDYRDYILDLFRLRTERNARFSSNAFARKLGIQASQLSLMRSRTDRISVKTAAKIAKSLDFSEDEADYFIELVRVSRNSDFSKVDRLHEVSRSHPVQTEPCRSPLPGKRIVLLKVDASDIINLALGGMMRIGRNLAYVCAACERLTADGYLKGDRTIDKSTHVVPMPEGKDQEDAIKTYQPQTNLLKGMTCQKCLEEHQFFFPVLCLSVEDCEVLGQNR